MSHPLLDEFCRSRGQLRPEFFRRCQRVFAAEVTPVLDEADRLRTENADLRTKLEELQTKAARRKTETVAS